MTERDQLTGLIIECAIEVHRHLGPGLLESIYESCLCHELKLREMNFQNQVALPLVYKGLDLGNAYRMDIIVENQVIIELKSIEAILPLHKAQLLSYMKLTNIRTGLLINFNVPLLKDGIVRMVL